MGVDLSKTVAPKVDQITADELLLTGPITGKVLRVYETGNSEQPVAIKLSCHEHPFKPCKGMRVVLIGVWGDKGDDYIGRSLRLFRNPDVKYGGIAIGGVEISHVTNITKAMAIPIRVSKGKKRPFLVEPLRDVELEKKPPEPKANAAEFDNLRQKTAIESEVLALENAMKVATTEDELNAVRPAWSKLTGKITPEQLKTLVDVKEAAKLRIAAVPAADAEVK